MKITNPITLDVARSNSYICLLAKQFDSNSRYLEITLADNGQPLTIPADASVVLRATRADGTGAVVSGTVANGKATVEIDDYILEVNGAVTLSLEISKDGETLTTPSCNLTIQKADANGWIRVYVADANKVAGNYYITIGGVSYSFTTSQAIPAGGSVYFSSNNATAETRDATGTVIETGLVLTEGTTGTQLVTDVPTMSFLATIAGRVAALESEMPNKADKDGIIALANNLTPYSADSGATQSVPFINQGTGCGNGESVVDTGSYCQLKKKLGNTVCVNQLVRNGDFADTSVWSNFSAWKSATVSDNTLHLVSNANQAANINIQQTSPVSPIVGHKYLFLIDIKGSKSSNLGASFGTTAGGCVFNVNGYPANAWTHIALIGTVSSYTDDTIYIRPKASDDAEEVDIYIKNVALIDLSLWHGSTDRIPSDLLSHPENWGRYYAGSLDYNAGTLESADGTVLKSIGRNVWDEEWELGIYNTSTGAKQSSSTRIRSKNLIPVIPNTQYYFRASANRELLQYDSAGNFIYYDLVDTSNQPFTTLPNCHFIAFSMYSGYGTTYLNNITISLYYPGESGYDQYYPYTVLAQIDTGSEVLRSAGAVADEKIPDGTITRRIGTITLDGTGVTMSSYNLPFRARIADAATPSSVLDLPNIQSTALVAVTQHSTWGTPFTACVVSGYLFFKLAENITTLEDAQTYLSSNPIALYYELATPTTEQGTAFSGASADNFAIDDFGSMYWTQSAGVPQGVEIYYPYDYKAAVDTILNEVNGDVTKLVTSEKVPDAPSSNGTYVLKVTVSGGTPTYSWIAE